MASFQSNDPNMWKRYQHLEHWHSYNCRMCGKEVDPAEIGAEPTSFQDEIRVCEACARGIKTDIFKRLIPADSDVHCKRCWSHIYACKCREKKDLDAIKS